MGGALAGAIVEHPDNCNHRKQDEASGSSLLGTAVGVDEGVDGGGREDQSCGKVTGDLRRCQQTPGDIGQEYLTATLYVRSAFAATVNMTPMMQKKV